MIQENLDQFKVIDTRRVKVPSRAGKSSNQQSTKIMEASVERTAVQHVASPPPSHTPTAMSPPTPTAKPSVSSTNAPQTPPVPPDYRFLLAWSYYFASQAAWLSPMLQQQQQQGQLPPSLPTDPEAAAKFIQTMQSMMDPLTTAQTSILANKNDPDDNEEIDSKRFVLSKEELNES